MKCFSCNKTAKVTLSYTKRQYCNSCFLKLIEKRIRKELRKSKEIKAKEKVLLLNDKSKEYFISKHFLQNIFGKHLEIKEVRVATSSSKKIIPWNMDRELDVRLREYFTNKKRKKEKNKVYLLKNILDEELMLIANILKIKSKKSAKNDFIEKVEKKYPGIKFSLYKSLTGQYL